MKELVRRFFNRYFNDRIYALIRKEFNQIQRDRRVAIALILPPTLQLLLFGFALTPTVSRIRLGVVDDCRTFESRDLISTLTESKSFQLTSYYDSADAAGEALSRNKVDAAVVIPYDFARDLLRGRPTTVQFLLNGMNANTSAISQGYALGVIQSYNRGLQEDLHASFRQVSAPELMRRGQALLNPAFLYNPGLDDKWFIVTGVLGLLLITNGSTVASTTMVKEREAGTIEQLLMSPASTTEVIIAKITPIFFLLCLMVLFAIALVRVVFHIPFHGKLPLVLGASSLCLLAGIGLGTVIATFSKSAQQAQLTSFFVNPPLLSLSGALFPAEAMPQWLQTLVPLNPVHHFVNIVRSCLLKGSGFGALWPSFLALFAFTLVLVSLSVWRFRGQLS